MTCPVRRERCPRSLNTFLSLPLKLVALELVDISMLGCKIMGQGLSLAGGILPPDSYVNQPYFHNFGNRVDLHLLQKTFITRTDSTCAI